MEKRYLAVFKNIPDPVFLLDESGAIEDKNRAAGELLARNAALKNPLRLFGELKPFLAGRVRELVFEKRIPIGRKTHHYEIRVRRIRGDRPGLIVFMRDTTRQKETEAVLREGEERLRSISQSAADAIISIDGSGHVVFWNRAAQDMFGYRPNEILGRSLSGIMPKRFWTRHQKQFRNFLKTGKPTIIGRTVELTARRKGGEEFPIELSLSRWETDKGAYFTGIIRDTTERKRLLEEIQKISITDQLTGLYNRRGFYLFAERQLLLSGRRQKGFLLFYADLDGLKWVNDQLGHPSGDQALMDAAQILTATFRRTDIIARLGGDEFLVLAIDSSERDGPYFITRLEKNLHAFNTRRARDYSLAISAGYACWDPKAPRSLDEVISEADARMYKEKFRRRANREEREAGNEGGTS